MEALAIVVEYLCYGCMNMLQSDVVAILSSLGGFLRNRLCVLFVYGEPCDSIPRV